MSAAIHARVLARRAAIEREREEAAQRDEFLSAARGTNGDTGPMPAHEWKGSRLRFQNPDGTWGEWVDLRGKPGKAGKDSEPGVIRVSGGGGRFNPADLSPFEDDLLLSDYLVLERGGQAFRISLGQLQILFGSSSGLPANTVTVNGEPMTVGGDYVTVTL